MHLMHSGIASLVVAVVVALVTSACSEGDERRVTPKIRLHPATGTVVFEGVPIGSTDLKPLIVRNEGAGDLVIREFAIQGPGQVFRIVDGVEGGTLTVPARESREILLEFAPTSTSRVEGVLELLHNDLSTSDRGRTAVRLGVRANDARIIVNPNPISFGRVAAGERAEITAAIVNLGSGPLVVTEYFIVGGNDAFQILPESQLREGRQVELGADDRHDIRISYEPLTSDFAQAALIVRSNDAQTSEGNYQVEIFGNGAEPCIEVTPASTFDFGERPVNETHRQSFTIRNCSDLDRGQPLIVTALELREDSSVAFALSSVPDLPLTLEPGETRGFDVEFTPTIDQQVEEAVVAIESNDSLTPELAVQLTGVGAVAAE